MRYKGGYGSLFSCFDKSGKRTCDKLSLKVSFNESDKKGRFHGVRKLVFNSCNRDPTCLRERVSYALFRAAGVVAPRAVHARLRVNGEPLGLFLLVEAIDKEFVQDHFAWQQGNLYKEVWPDRVTPQHYIDALKTNDKPAPGTQPDVSRMVAFAKALQSAADADFDALVDAWLDRPVMTRYLVVDQVINNWDGIWKFYCASASQCRNHNYYVYDDKGGSGRIVVVPWDLDHTFNVPNADMARSWWQDGPDVCEIKHDNPLIGTRAPQCDPLLRGLMRQGWKAFLAQVDALTSDGGALGIKAQHAQLDRYRAAISADVATDPHGPGLVAWNKATAVLRAVMTEQHGHARELLQWKGP